MNKEKTIEILEALASGCSPETGEVLHNESVLNQRDVIRALQIAIIELKEEKNSSEEDSSLIPLKEMKKAIDLFQSLEYSPTYGRLTHFFLKSKLFEFPILNDNELYGKYKGHYSNEVLSKFVKIYLIDNGFSLQGKLNLNSDGQNWRNVTHFEGPMFNKLSEMAVNQLKEKVNALGILKTENLSEFIQNKRVLFPRAYESWSKSEKELLKKALQYTNDLNLLVECFQRGHSSVKSSSKRIIFTTSNK